MNIVLILVAVILFGVHVAQTRGRDVLAWAFFFAGLAIAWPALRAAFG